MADQNTYLAYKRDTAHLIYWMIHASNTIIKSAPSSISEVEGAPTSLNTTGQISVSSMVPISKLIVKHIKPIPATIFRLFESVIAARKATHSAFQQIVAIKPDPEIEKSNKSHSVFIDNLTRAFENLGGNTWKSERKTEADIEDVVDVVFANKFSTLGLNDASDNDEEDLDDSAEASQQARQKQSNGSKKKGKKGKKGKGKGKAKTPVKEANLDDVPLESYRIIEDEDGLVTDYLMAVYSLSSQWTELRDHLQGLWRQVAYGGLNGAVAGTMSNIAIATIRKTEAAIFVDFPGHDSYETVMKTITRGNPEKAQGQFSVGLHRRDANGKPLEQHSSNDIDVKEQLMIHAYQDLMDFVVDFQYTRSGKPTKGMMAEIRDWDPKFNLEKATKKQRIKWRRSYTINWLYDLVNVFSSIVVQRINQKGQRWVLENVDWSVKGPWNKHRRLYGLNEFAGVVTTLAMQKSGTDVRSKVPPSCVFQLQSIVDSLMVSRGWSTSAVYDHVLIPPAVSHPRRDVDMFMDRTQKNLGRGHCSSVDILIQVLEKDANQYGDPIRHKKMRELLKMLQEDFVNWLGESKYMYGLTTIPSSRFSNSNTNGLWEYSPFLCGVGLMEALELTYNMGMRLWDDLPEATCIIHLHNMLVERGYISRPVGLYGTLEHLFASAYFADGEPPTSDFLPAFIAMTRPASSERGTQRAMANRRAAMRSLRREANDIHGLLDPDANMFYKEQSFLKLYRDAEWYHERIPDDKLPKMSGLGMIRIAQTKQITDPVTGKRVLERTFLIKRALTQGISDESLLAMNDIVSEMKEKATIADELLPPLPEDYTRAPPMTFGRSALGTKVLPGERDLMHILYMDILSDVCGQIRPLSSLNYFFVTINFLTFFMRVEEKLKASRNPVYVRAYEEDPVMMRSKRVSLTSLALIGEDEECSKVMANVFEDPRAGFMDFIYWEDLRDNSKLVCKDPLDHLPSAGCLVM